MIDHQAFYDVHDLSPADKEKERQRLEDLKARRKKRAKGRTEAGAATGEKHGNNPEDQEDESGSTEENDEGNDGSSASATDEESHKGLDSEKSVSSPSGTSPTKAPSPKPTPIKDSPAKNVPAAST